MAVSYKSFVQQVESARKHFQPVSLEQVVEAQQNGTELPPRAMLVTFDDGYWEFGDMVVPVLATNGFPSVQFARVPEADGLPSWAPLDLLREVLLRANVVGAPAMAYLSGEGRERLLRLPSAEQLQEVMRISRRLGVNVAGIGRAAVYAPAADWPSLRWDDVAIGGHGTTHERWTQLDLQELTETLHNTAQWLDRINAKRVLAWPDGAVDHRTADAAQKTGFVLGFALHDAPSELPAALAIPRRLVPDEPDWVERLADRRAKEAA